MEFMKKIEQVYNDFLLFFKKLIAAIYIILQYRAELQRYLQS